MTENVKKADFQASPQAERMSIRGKLLDIRRTQDQTGFIHTVVCAAPDEFSQPNSYQVMAAQQLGQVNDVIEGPVKVSGYVRKFSYRDKNTGLQKEGAEAKTYLRWDR